MWLQIYVYRILLNRHFSWANKQKAGTMGIFILKFRTWMVVGNFETNKIRVQNWILCSYILYAIWIEAHQRTKSWCTWISMYVPASNYIVCCMFAHWKSFNENDNSWSPGGCCSSLHSPFPFALDFFFFQLVSCPGQITLCIIILFAPRFHFIHHLKAHFHATFTVTANEFSFVWNKLHGAVAQLCE